MRPGHNYSSVVGTIRGKTPKFLLNASTLTRKKDAPQRCAAPPPCTPRDGITLFTDAVCALRGAAGCIACAAVRFSLAGSTARRVSKGNCAARGRILGLRALP